MVGDAQFAGTPSRDGAALPLAHVVVAAHVERSPASATSFVLRVDDGARAIAQQLAGGPMGLWVVGDVASGALEVPPAGASGRSRLDATP